MERMWIRKTQPGLVSHDSWVTREEVRRWYQSLIYAYREQLSVQNKELERMKSLKVEFGSVLLSKLLLFHGGR